MNKRSVVISEPVNERTKQKQSDVVAKNRCKKYTKKKKKEYAHLEFDRRSFGSTTDSNETLHHTHKKRHVIHYFIINS